MTYLGVDIGGTFTDLVLMDEDGTITSAKALTALGELEKGAPDAIELVRDDRGVNVHSLLKQIKACGPDTTTKAIIERTGARTGLNHYTRLRRNPLCTPISNAANTSGRMWNPSLIGSPQ